MARSIPAAAESLSIGDGALDACCEVIALDDDRRASCDLDERRLGNDDDGGAACHRLDDRKTEALEVRRLHEARRAPVELGESLDGDVSLETGASLSQLSGHRLVLRRSHHDELEPRLLRRGERRHMFLRAWIAPTESA